MLLVTLQFLGIKPGRCFDDPVEGEVRNDCLQRQDFRLVVQRPVIGTVSSDAKAELARAHGCDHPVIYSREDFAARVRELTDNKLLPVVYDSVGKDTFAKSLDCLAPFGMMVVYGAASGPVPPFDIGQLAAKGSLFLTRPTLATYTAKRDDLVWAANDLFDVVAKGIVKIEINQRFPLAEAGAAHTALEARKTTGSTLLVP